MDPIKLIISLLELLAGVGIFIVGMNMMGDGLEKGAGHGLKGLFNKISNNRFAGIGIGTAVTAIIQSSSATSVMVIGFVNAGVMTLFQAASIILGANIGTTVTGLIVALQSLGQNGAEVAKTSISFSDIAIVLAFVGVMMMFAKKKEKIKLAGTILCGLGVIFVGLDIMSGSLKGNEINEFFSNKVFAPIADLGIAPILFIIVGAIFTAIIQSSSAATGIVIIMAGSGVIDVQDALFIVLGSNIGTCVTALLACIGTGTNAKRTTFIHFFNKIAGVVVFTPFIWIFREPIVNFLESATGGNIQFQIALFHVIFNVTNAFILAPFISHIVKLAEMAIKEKKTTVDEFKPKFIDERILITPAIAYEQAKKEIGYMANLAKENIVASLAEINEPTKEMPPVIYGKENDINLTNKALTDFLIKLSSEVNAEYEKHVGAFFHVINDLERIGDHAKNFLEISEELIEKGLELSKSAKDEVAYMASKVTRMFTLAIEIFEETDEINTKSPEVTSRLTELSAIETETDKLKKEYISNHFTRLAAGECIASHSPYYMSIVTRLERVADHLVNVGYSIVNPTGSQSQID